MGKNSIDNLLSIDENRLLEEWDQQSKLVMEYSEKLADARRELEYAKIREKVEEAEIAQKVRSNPEKYGLEKTTNEAVKEEVTIRMGRHKVNSVVEAKHTVDILQGVMEAIDNRKRALQDHASLFIAKYWGAPREPEDPDGEFDRLKDKRFAKRTKKGTK